jgi:hypothetical protein
MSDFLTKAFMFGGLLAGTFAFVGIAANARTINKGTEGLSQGDRQAVFAVMIQGNKNSSCEALQTPSSKAGCTAATSDPQRQNHFDVHLIPRVFKAAFN